MKNRKLIGWSLAALLVSTLPASLPSSRLAGQTIEKICPITFRLYPGTKLESSCAARVERDNVVLSGFLSAMRTDEGLQAYMGEARAILANIRLSDEGKQKALQASGAKVAAWLKTKANPFQGTYLEDPALTTETGTRVVGLEAVVIELARIVASSTYVDAQSVRVELEYLPYGSPEYLSAQTKYPDTQKRGPVDIIAHIKTILAYAPHDEPVRIEGLLPHRFVCFD
jgi:hypothetical protein